MRDRFDLSGEKRVNGPIRVFIVDNDDLFRQKTHAALERAKGITVVGQARDGREAISLIHKTDPDVVLLGIDTSRASNVEPTAQIRESFPHTKIVVLHDEGQEKLVLDVLRNGALGHLDREKAQPAEIVQAIRAVARGEAVISSGVAGRILDQISQKKPDKRPGHIQDIVGRHKERKTAD
jgi:DNA-binding NarL/FixJ family response regulator